MIRIFLLSIFFVFLQLPLFSQPANQITYIANAGVFIECKGKSVLIDALHLRDSGYYQQTKFPYVQAMLNAKAPFDSVHLFLVTHLYSDHFNKDLTVDFLKKHYNSLFMAPQQVVDSIPDNQLLERQIYALERNEQGEVLKMDGLSVTTIPLLYSFPQENAWVDNMGYLIDFDGLRILHLGDAELTIDNFKKIQSVIKNKVDYAIVPHWLLEGKGKKWMKKYVNAKKYIAVHIPTYETGVYETRLQKELAKEGMEVNVFLRTAEFELLDLN